LIFDQIVGGNNIFRGYVFPDGIDFSKRIKEFNQPVDFSDAKFEGKIKEGNFKNSCVVFSGVNFKSGVSFLGAEFSGGNAEFRGVSFSGSDLIFNEPENNSKSEKFSKEIFNNKTTNFSNAKFNGGIANFRNAKFYNENIFFIGAEFSGGKAEFGGAKFLGGEANFMGALFSRGNADFFQTTFSGEGVIFGKAKFTGGIAYFRSTVFSGKTANFIGAEFSNRILFYKNQIKCSLDFSFVEISDKSRFDFCDPEFIKSEENIKILFKGIIFNPFATYFENIKGISENKNKRNNIINPAIIFRYCNLKDAYFTNNDISIFSFYKSAYDEARFYSCNWKNEKRDKILKIIPYKRKNIICDEQLYELAECSDDKEKFKKDYEIEDLNGYNEIATLYRRFKTSLDNTKDYSEAGKFYFNEQEMKRKALREKFEKWWRSILNGEMWKWLLYSLYKVFMGYGEKPFWSLVWLLFSGIIVFPIVHLFNGLQIRCMMINSYWDALKYTISRFLPSTYLPEQWANIKSTGWGVVPFFNSIVLILFVIFIGIGLKRHFRRF
jgi:uncharacterized protein YjbI with pentapeptide repeats